MKEYDLDILRLSGKGYCCSQIIVKLGLELAGEENPGLIRATSGLCTGIGGEGSCGALTGAACLLGYHAGKGEDMSEEDDRLPLMLSTLSDWFKQYCDARFTGTKCADIVENGQINPEICGGLVSECFGQALLILTDNGFDPANRDED